MKENYLAVIPAAGKGIRAICLTGYGAILKPFINATGMGSTVLEEIVKEISSSGLSEISVIVSCEDDEKVFRRFFKPFNADPTLEDNLKSRGMYDDIKFINKLSSLNVSFFHQPVAKGFGDAIAQVYPKIEQRKDDGKNYDGIAVILGDDMVYSKTPCCKQLISAHKQTGCMIVGVQQISYEEAKKFGVVLIDTEKGGLEFKDKFLGRSAYKVIGVEEKPDDPIPNIIDGRKLYYAILGRYVLNYGDIRFLAGQDGSPNNELDFTSLFRKNINEQRLIAVEIDGDWHTVGSSLSAQKASIRYGFGQCDKDGKIGEDGRQLALYAIKVMKEEGLITETSSLVFKLCDKLKVCNFDI